MAPERAGPERASRGGVSLARFLANSEGPCRGTSLLGRTRTRVGAAASMAAASDCYDPAGQRKTSHAVKKEPAAHPPGKKMSLTQ
jgi:hypothetical protein